LQQLLAGINPEKSFAAFNQRLDQLEERFDVALRDVALRSDVASLGLVAAHARELSAQFEHARTQLARLDTIERHLRELAHYVEEQCQSGFANLAALSPDNLAVMIESAVERAATRMTSAISPAPNHQHDQRIDSLEELLKSYVAERHRSEEITTGVLRSIEDALGHIRDRLDAMEAYTPAADAIDDADAFLDGSPERESDALADAYAKGARALGQDTPGHMLHAADYPPSSPPRIFSQKVSSLEPLAEAQQAETALAARLQEELDASALRAKLKAQAANAQNATAVSDTPQATDAGGVRTKRRGPFGGARMGVLVPAMICLFGAGYLIIDDLLSRADRPAQQAESALNPATISGVDPAAPGLAGLLQTSSELRKREDKPPAERRRDTLVPPPHPTQRQHTPETVSEDLG
jgi:hypothetical protein